MSGAVADLDQPPVDVPITFGPVSAKAKTVIEDRHGVEHWMVALEVRCACGIQCHGLEPQAACDLAGELLESAIEAHGQNDLGPKG